MSNTRIIEIPATMQTGKGKNHAIRKLRVAAYCRVSTEEEEQQSSFETQKLYYTEKITSTPEWEIAGIYADDGISGVHTKKRDGFNQMIQDCKKRKIDRDMVIMSIRAPRMLSGEFLFMATPHNSRLTMRVPQPDIIEHFGNADAVPQPPERCLSRTSGAKAPRTLRPLPLLRFAVSATGGAHLCSIQYYLRFWLGTCRTSLAVSALRIMRYCPNYLLTFSLAHPGSAYSTAACAQ